MIAENDGRVEQRRVCEGETGFKYCTFYYGDAEMLTREGAPLSDLDHSRPVIVEGYLKTTEIRLYADWSLGFTGKRHNDRHRLDGASGSQKKPPVPTAGKRNRRLPGMEPSAPEEGDGRSLLGKQPCWHVDGPVWIDKTSGTDTRIS